MHLTLRSEKSGYKIIYVIFLTLQIKKKKQVENITKYLRLVISEQLNYGFSLFFSLPSKCNNIL